MSQQSSGMPDYMPRNPKDMADITSYLGASKKWDVVHTEILEQSIVILDVTGTKHASKQAALCTIQIDGQRKVCLFASKVLADQLIGVSEHLPLTAKVVQKGKRYHFAV